VWFNAPVAERVGGYPIFDAHLALANQRREMEAAELEAAELEAELESQS
jgi:hypothetical protein